MKSTGTTLPFSRFARLSFLAGLAGLTVSAQAIDVFLEFRTGADVLLGGSWADAGYPGSGEFSFGASDFLIVQHSVKEKMEAIYGGYTIAFHNFSDVPGVPFTTIDFGASGGAAGLLGESPTLDWRNPTKTETVDIYSGKFGPTLMGGAMTAPAKAAELERLSNALANIAAHELGHSLGLQHYDAYGQSDLRAPSYSGVSGSQNGKIMSSGPSGATIPGLGDGLKTFSDLSRVKLAFADGVVASTGVTIVESPVPNGSFASAQHVLGSALPGLGVNAVNISGSLGTAGDDDFYSFDAVMGSLMTFNTFSQSIFADSCNTKIELYDALGGLLFSNDDISYDPSSFMSGAGLYGTDSLIMNYEAGYTGKYFLRVFGTDSGEYNLLATGVVPEPGSMVLFGLGIAAIVARRSKRK